VRHKVLDLIGDLALVGRPIVGEITAHRAGHALHSRFVAKVLASVPVMDEDAVEVIRHRPAPSFA
jgi:UDP-3-O-[3-hydroxymyristoyl] N-acetylglucosamine deacetylase